eukprot:TRINITY_DN8974_c0_g1_i1.p8 TRINITY_DN8974_c0_g1~~TRINITY_DN8974_c0_g1_i1.p8  ORF type:complete len:127 (-),score=7.06 TRINITY_DN8974_c0_g1_i1:1888-2268(-)
MYTNIGTCICQNFFLYLPEIFRCIPYFSKVRYIGNTICISIDANKLIWTKTVVCKSGWRYCRSPIVFQQKIVKYCWLVGLFFGGLCFCGILSCQAWVFLGREQQIYFCNIRGCVEPKNQFTIEQNF